MANWLDTARDVTPERKELPSWANTPISKKEESLPKWASGAIDISPPPTPAPLPTISQEEEKVPEYLQPEDFDRLAAKYGVSSKDLRELAPYYGVNAETEPSLGAVAKEGAKYTAGFAGRSVGLGIPQFLYKKTQSAPMRKALDELTAIGQKQRPLLETASEFAAPGGAIGQASERAAVRLAGTTATGAAVGAANAPEGQEVHGAVTGGALGLGLGVAGETLASIAARRGAGKAEVEALLEAEPRSMEFNLDKHIDAEAARTAKSDTELERMILKGEAPASYQAAEQILEEQMGPETVRNLLNTDTPEGAALAERAISREPDTAMELGSQRASVIEATRDLAEKRAIDFAERELKLPAPKNYEQAVSQIQEYGSRQGPEYLQTKYRDYTRRVAAERAVEEQGLRAMPETGLGKVSNKISGAQFALRNIDDKFGVGSERALSILNRGTNKMTYPRATFRRRLDEVYQLAKKTGTDPAIRNSDTILKAIESGNTGALPADHQNIASRISDYFDSVRNFANRVATRIDPVVQRMGIPKLENYVTRVSMETSDLIPRVERALDVSNEAARKMFNRELRQLSLAELDQLSRTQPEVQNLVEFMNWKDSTKAVPRSGASLVGQVKDALYSDAGISRLEKASSATMERTGHIPDFIREKNLYKVMDRYTYDVLSILYRRRGLDALRQEMHKLESVGADVPAKYLENIITDTLGSRKGTAARVFSAIKTEIARKLDHRIEAATGARKLALKTTKELIHLPAYINRQIYGNVLGWLNPRPVIQNLVSGIGRTAPELGTAYGTYAYLRGLVGAIANYRKTGKLVRKAGLIPQEFTRQGERALVDGLRSTGLFAKGADALESAGKLGMSLYRMSEDINRSAIYHTAQVMTNDLARGSKLARESLSRLPYSIRKQVLSASSPQEVHQLLAGYLNDVTAFNYNRSSMFELGRDLGPLFSTFTKWPTEVMGEALYELRSKGLVRGMGANAQRMLPILAAFAGFDYLLNNYADTEDSDIYKKFMGSKGLKGAAPINSITGVVSGEIFTPPAVDAIMQGIINPIVRGDTPKLEKGLDRLASQFVPGAGFVKLITDDIPTYLTGSRPEGDTAVERIPEGIRKLERMK